MVFTASLHCLSSISTKSQSQQRARTEHKFLHQAGKLQLEAPSPKPDGAGDSRFWALSEIILLCHQKLLSSHAPNQQK